jgi:hypothetical protein
MLACLGCLAATPAWPAVDLINAPITAMARPTARIGHRPAQLGSVHRAGSPMSPSSPLMAVLQADRHRVAVVGRVGVRAAFGGSGIAQVATVIV